MTKRLATLLAATMLSLGMLAGPAFAAGPGAAHQSIASTLKGDTATIMPGHVSAAHQSIAATLKGDTATIMPDHVRGPR
jgi:hypothetical protein